MKQLCGSGNCRRFQGERRPRCAEPGLRLCRTCCARVRDDIAELPRLYEECESALTQLPFVLDHKVRGGERRGLNLNEAAVNARLNMKSVLATWSGMVADERRLSKLARRDVAHLVTFLMVHLNWLLAHPAAPDFVDEIAVIASTARRASRSGPALHLDLGLCVQDSCDGAMFATRSGRDASSSLQVRCEAGHVWRPQEWLLLARRVRQGNSDPGAAGEPDTGRPGHDRRADRRVTAGRAGA
jgi:hypothetical protein